MYCAGRQHSSWLRWCVADRSAQWTAADDNAGRTEARRGDRRTRGAGNCNRCLLGTVVFNIFVAQAAEHLNRSKENQCAPTTDADSVAVAAKDNQAEVHQSLLFLYAY